MRHRTGPLWRFLESPPNRITGTTSEIGRLGGIVDNVVEQHGCIVCGKLYNLLVVYDPDGKLVDSTVTTPNGHPVWDDHWPLVACNKHSEADINSAIANHYPGKAKDDLEDD
jgi:hypothetical protein